MVLRFNSAAQLFFFHMVYYKKCAHLSKQDAIRSSQIKPRRSCLAQLGSADLINKIKKFQGESKVLWRRFPRMTPVNSLEINQLRWVTQSHASLPQTPKPFSRGQFAFSLFSPCYFLIRRGMQLAISMSNLLEDSFSLWRLCSASEYYNSQLFAIEMEERK